jgi:hypothetical protein
MEIGHLHESPPPYSTNSIYKILDCFVGCVEDVRSVSVDIDSFDFFAVWFPPKWNHLSMTRHRLPAFFAKKAKVEPKKLEPTIK